MYGYDDGSIHARRWYRFKHANRKLRGVSPVCISGSSVITYQGTSAGPSDSFTWDFDGGNIVSGSGSGPYTISWNSTGAKTITLTVTNTTGCASMI